MHQHEAAAADIAGLRMRHREREADRDRGVDCIAAGFENIDPHMGRALFLAPTMPFFARTGRKRAVLVRIGACAGGAVWASANETAADKPAAAIAMSFIDRSMAAVNWSNGMLRPATVTATTFAPIRTTRMILLPILIVQSI